MPKPQQFHGGFLMLCILVVLESCTPSNEPQQGWIKQSDLAYSYQLNNSKIIVDPGYGGRITQLKINGIPLLTGPEIDPINYGSTLWPSPQSTWNWPPPAELDSQPYQVTLAGDSLRLVSRTDTTLQLAFSKEIIPQAKDTSFHIIYAVTNTKDSVQNYTIWEVSRLQKNSTIYFQLEEEQSLRLFKKYNKLMPENHTFYSIQVNTKDTMVDKMYANTQGWVAYRKDSLLLLKTFQDINIGEVPPAQNELEIYIDESGYLEMEQHSAYITLAPGETFRWKVIWYPRSISSTRDLYHFIGQIQ